MEIEIVWGSDEGTTPLGAFDAALADAGVHNYNHVRLSSVIPPDAAIVETGTHDGQWDVGTIVASVLASNESSTPGETIAAGLGWRRAEEGGIFFEGSGDSTDVVDSRVRRGIDSGTTHRPDWHWQDDIRTRVVDHTVERHGAVVVVALYRPLPPSP